MLSIRPLTTRQITAIYHAHMRRDFAPDELKPLDAILRPAWLGSYRGYGLFEEGHLRGYALLLLPPDGRVALLDYYAILSDARGRGYGGAFLSLLRQELSFLDGIVLETERISCAVGQEERCVRRRRVAFYQRSGCRITGLTSRLFGVDFSIMYLPCQRDISDGRLYIELDRLYRRLFSRPFWERQVFISWRAIR